MSQARQLKDFLGGPNNHPQIQDINIPQIRLGFNKEFELKSTNLPAVMFPTSQEVSS